MKSNNDISNARYYANAAEQQILIQGLQRYFSLPERSQNRNKITKEVSQFLQCFSPHWSHRAVRLWFNNNKHSYFNNQNAMAESANNPSCNFPVINTLAQNNLKMKIHNQGINLLAQNNANIPLNNPSLLKVPFAPIPSQHHQSQILMQGVQYQNFNKVETRDQCQMQLQGNPSQQNLGSNPPMIQKLNPKSVPVKKQQQPKSNVNQQQQQPQTVKQQFVVPQISKAVSSVPQVAPSQLQTASSSATPSSITMQPSKPPLEVKIAPRIPQPQIQQNPNKTISSSSSLPPKHFQKIPTPQIDKNLYTDQYKNKEIKKKVTVMPPIKISSAASSKPPSSSITTSFSQPISSSSSEFNQPFWGSNNNNSGIYARGSSSELGTTRERMCKQITALLKDIRETTEESPDRSSSLKMKIDEFEKMCRDFRALFGFLSPQIIDPSFKFTRFPVHDPIREMPGSLSSLSLSLLPSTGLNEYNDGFGGDMNSFMYNDMGSLGNLSAFGRSDSNFSLSAFSPSTSMNLINDPISNAALQNENSLFDISGIQNSGRDESLSNFEIFGKSNENEKNNSNASEQSEEGTETPRNHSFTCSSSPSFAPSTSSSIDASMSGQSNLPSSVNQKSQSIDNDSNYNSRMSRTSLNASSNPADNGFLDQISHNSIWQARSFKSTHIPYFECTSMSRGLEIAAYAYKHIDFNNHEHHRAICFTTRNSNNENFADVMHESWRTVLVDCQSVVESMVVDEDSAWLLTNREIIHSSLFSPSNENSFENEFCASSHIELPQEDGSRCLSLIGNSGDYDYGVVACFSSSSDLLFINSNNDQEVQPVHTDCSGISCIAALSSDMVACGVPLNGTVVLVNRNGDEIRSLVGHCGAVLGVYPLFSSNEEYETNLFASRADDNTIRVWDVRERIPLFQITTTLTMASNSTSSSLNSLSSTANLSNLSRNSSSNQQMLSYCSFLNVEGNDQYLMFGLHDQIGVIDIRKDFAKPLLGVTTDDYDPISLVYNQDLNTVAMFGEVGSIASKDSMLFVGNDGQSRKRIFRTYNNFIG